MSLTSHFLRSAAFGCVLFAGLATSFGVEAKVLATVNGVQITDQDVTVATADLGPTIPEQLQGDQREQYVLTYLIDLNLVSNRAIDQKLDQSPDFAKQMAYYREKALMEGLMDQVAHQAVTDQAIRQAYDVAAKAQPPETEIHARHILVPTKEEAEAALKRVKAGEDFGKVADQVSKDTSGNGGDLGWFTKDKMVPAFADAAFKLQPGQISDPVQTQFGWHIIKVEGSRQKQFPPLEEVRSDVERYLQQKAQGDLIMGLRQGAKIERFDAAPAPAVASPPPGGAAPGGK